MKNVKIEVKNDTIVLTIDAKQDFGISKTGKSKVVASTEGFTSITGTDIRINLNAIK